MPSMSKKSRAGLCRQEKVELEKIILFDIIEF